MTEIPTPLRVFVVAVVTLTGGGFGALAGTAYSNVYWWVAMVAGGLSAFGLAWFYLGVLSKMPPTLNGAAAWFLGTLVAVGCGVVCTVAAHGPMWVLYDPATSGDLHGMDLRGAILTVGLVIGAIAGLFVGGICTLAYLGLRQDLRKE